VERPSPLTVKVIGRSTTLHVQLSNSACNLSNTPPIHGIFCPERLLRKSSNEKRSEICIREQFVSRMVRYGGEIENCDFDKEGDANVGLFGMSFSLRYKAIGVSKNFGERCQNSRFTANK